MKTKKKRIQPRIYGGRYALPSSVIPEIDKAVDYAARKFNVSKSWIVAVALADFFGIKEQVTYK